MKTEEHLVVPTWAHTTAMLLKVTYTDSKALKSPAGPQSALILAFRGTEPLNNANVSSAPSSLKAYCNCCRAAGSLYTVMQSLPSLPSTSSILRQYWLPAMQARCTGSVCVSTIHDMHCPWCCARTKHTESLHISVVCIIVRILRLCCAMQWFTDFATAPPRELPAQLAEFGQVHEGFALALGLESSRTWDVVAQGDPLLPARGVHTSYGPGILKYSPKLPV